MKTPDNDYLCLTYNETKTGVKVTFAKIDGWRLKNPKGRFRIFLALNHP